MNCTPSFSGVRDGSRGRTRGVYDPAHAPSGAASSAEEPNPRAPARLLWGWQTGSARMPQEILCALKPQLLPKDAACLTAPRGSQSQGTLCRKAWPWGARERCWGLLQLVQIHPSRWSWIIPPAGPGASFPLVPEHPSRWSRSIPPAWHSDGTVLVQPTPDWAPQTSLTFISHLALAFIFSTRQ